MSSFVEYRQDLASKIKQEPDKSKRREILENARNTSDYYVSFYSKKEGIQKSSSDVLDYLISKSYETKLLEDIPMYVGINGESFELFKIKSLIVDFEIYKSYGFDVRELIEKIKEKNSYLAESLQKYSSINLSLKKTLFESRAKIVLVDEKINKLEETSSIGKDSIKKLQNLAELTKLRQIKFLAQSEFQNTKNSITKINSVLSEMRLLQEKIRKFDFIPKYEGESITERKEFSEVPENYISLFHFTRKDVVTSIDNEGLVTSKQPEIVRRNQVFLDSYKTNINSRYRDRIDELSRSNSLYAFMDPEEAYNHFEIPSTEFVMLEIKVDPSKCFVVSFDQTTNYIEQAALRNSMDFIGVGFVRQIDFGNYWKGVVSYEDFVKFYYSDGQKKVNAPIDLPNYIESPEVMIISDVPQKHIKVFKK